jgi:hypothetical protein
MGCEKITAETKGVSMISSTSFSDGGEIDYAGGRFDRLLF